MGTSSVINNAFLLVYEVCTTQILPVKAIVTPGTVKRDDGIHAAAGAGFPVGVAGGAAAAAAEAAMDTVPVTFQKRSIKQSFGCSRRKLPDGAAVVAMAC